MVGAWALGANIALNAIFLVLFFRVFYNGSPALATSMAAYVNFFALLWIFRQRFGRLGFRRVMKSLGRIASAAAVMGLGCAAFLRFSDLAEATHFVWRAAMAGGAIAGAAGLYLALAWLFRCEELGELRSVLRRADAAT